MKIIISSKREIVLPAELCRQDGIEAGQAFEIQRVGPGKYLLKRTKGLRRQGPVDLLLACPVKDWFESADRSEMTG
jgi:bifunctional DNA-binding transcriptional regulator/antitoxin component of YhaV-PrlF toxin-antitoxin module